MRIITLILGFLIGISSLFCQNNSQFISQNGPQSVSPGQTFNITVTFKNTGNTSWSGSSLYRLGTQNPQDNTIWGVGTRVALPNDVAPGEEVTFSINLTAPEYGNAIQWQMVQDGVEWFGELSDIYPIAIITNPASDSLLSDNSHLSVNSHIVGTHIFHWYESNAGQLSGPWIPVEGRENWTGDIDFWKRMTKQIMAANIDVLYILVIPTMEQQRINLFRALYELRKEGWDVPKACPFFDTRVTYTLLGYAGNTGSEEGIDEFVSHYIRFYNQYFSQNPDQYADDYIYTQDNIPVLNVYSVNDITGATNLTREDISGRLSVEFGIDHPIFNNSIKMIGVHEYTGSTNLTFIDEQAYQFISPEVYYKRSWAGSVKTAMVKPGFWNENIRNPGIFIPREGGVNYKEAWNSVKNSDQEIFRVFIETFNEYDEGTGIYAAKTDTVYRISTNTNTDTWSSSGDPYEYIKITASEAALFNDIEELDAKILWHNIPDNMVTGETFNATVIVRNDGDESWSAANGLKFGQHDTDTQSFGTQRYLIDDTQDEIPIYGGIFRGRAKTFNVEIVAPNVTGSFVTNWQMLKDGVAWFGGTIVKTINISAATGLNENSIIQDFTIYPNPVNINNEITINGEFNTNDVISMYDISGNKLFEKKLSSDRNNFKINLPKYNLQEGIYFIRLKSHDNIQTKKMLIKN